MWSFRRTLILVGAAGCWVGALSISSCGGSSTTDDAGQDVTAPDVQKEAAADVVKDTQPPPCMVDADLNTLQIPDASIDGGVNTGVCWSCLKGGCQSYITQCNMTCDCKQGVIDFLNCMNKGGTLQACGAGLATIDPNFAFAFGSCAVSNCTTQCGLSGLLDAGKDGG
jgi:hypothetical protein